MARGTTSLDPNALSESETLGAAIDLLTDVGATVCTDAAYRKATGRKMAEAIDLLFALQRQAKAGVHKNRRPNPLLTILGNPLTRGKALQAGELLSRNVQAVLYIHDQDGLPYAHGFGDAEITLKTHRDGTVVIGGLEDRTGVAMMGLKGGEILLFDEKEMPF